MNSPSNEKNIRTHLSRDGRGLEELIYNQAYDERIWLKCKELTDWILQCKFALPTRFDYAIIDGDVLIK